jgi:hypothetical protein
MSSPPATIIYYVPTDYRARDWAGSDIAFISVLGVILLVVVTCLFADCFKTPIPETRRRRGGDRNECYDGFEEGLRQRS